MAITLDQLALFFGWCTLINSAVLALFTIVLILCRHRVAAIHAKLFDLPESTISAEYFSFLSTYKAIITALNIVPYIALKIMLAAA